MNQTVSIQRLCNPRRGEACPFTVGLGSPMEEKRPWYPFCFPCFLQWLGLVFTKGVLESILSTLLSSCFELPILG